MVDVSGGIPAPRSRRRDISVALRQLGGQQVTPRKAWTVVAVLAVAVFYSFWLYEGLFSNVVFTAATTLAIGSIIAFVSRRALFSAASVTIIVVLIHGISSVKQKMLGMVLHAYDIIFYLGSWSTITYLWSGARSYMVVFLLAVTVAVALAFLTWRIDSTRVSRWSAGLVLVLSIAVATATGLTKPDRRQTQFYWNALYVSSFYSSWAETVETLWRGQLIESATAATAPPFTVGGSCKPAVKPPHIILIHQESIVQPSLFPSLAYDRGVDPFFKSGDGQLHKLRVETYGGASWLTEFSILTGLSTHSFGGMRPFVQSLLAGKVRDTLPETLERCGYRNVLFYPMLKNFVSNARFYDAVGLREIFDLKAQGAKSTTERDRFYYGNALNEMERHVKASEKPLFSYIQTMSVHWPYDYAFEPEMKVPGGGPGTDPEMHEYLRRLSIAKIDYDWFKAELKRRFPNEPVLIVHYGDHHPMATRKLLGFHDDTDVEEVAIEPHSIGFTTYYAVEALNYKAPELPQLEAMDVPYLGTIILEQAGLPLSEPNKERLRLMAACDGRYHTCRLRHEILAFHRRLIESRLIDQR